MTKSCRDKMNKVNILPLKDDVNRFVQALLRSEAGEKIAKVILFGSLIKGKAGKDSDIDILVVANDGKQVADKVADVLLDIQIQGCGPIESITVDIDDIYFTRDYFLYNVLKYGKEVYSMPEEEIIRLGARRLMNLSEEYLQSASDAIQRGHLRLGLDGAYNSAELAAKGLLLLVGITDLPGSHGGVVQLFGEKYVKSDRCEREIGRSLNRALELRNSARYRYEVTIEKQDAEKVLDLAKKLNNLLSSSLRK
jgi:uncharacterized protein (UPF0332 family)/predicted nucleotidyltransferase